MLTSNLADFFHYRDITQATKTDDIEATNQLVHLEYSDYYSRVILGIITSFMSLLSVLKFKTAKSLPGCESGSQISAQAINSSSSSSS